VVKGCWTARTRRPNGPLESPDNPIVDVANPPLRGAFIYLIQAQNSYAVGQGTLGDNPAGPPRVGLSCP
jgi:hypothetical protein